MPVWGPPYLIRRSTRILSFAEHQNHSALQLMGESCYLLKRLARADATFHRDDRQVSTMTKIASGYTADPETGFWRHKLWDAATSQRNEYPDVGVFTATVQGSGGASDVWEAAVDKYSFVTDRQEYAFDSYRNQLDSDGNEIPDALYIVFNTPPFSSSFRTTMNFGTISPAVNPTRMQPDIDNEPGFYNSLFAYEQWIKDKAIIRQRIVPNRFLLAFPGTATDLLVAEGGFIRESKTTYWTNVPDYAPIVKEWDVVVREATGERFQVVNYTPIYIENILVSQHFDLAELDPRSSVYQVPILSG